MAAGTIGKDGRLPRVMSERAGEVRLLVGEDKWPQQDHETSASAVPKNEGGAAELDAGESHGAMFSEFGDDESQEPFDPSDPYMTALGNDDDTLPKDMIEELMGANQG